MYGTIQTGKCMFEGAIRDSLALGTFLYTFYRIQMVEGWNCRPREGRSGGARDTTISAGLKKSRLLRKPQTRRFLML